MSKTDFDLIVEGAGTVGISTAFWAQKEGLKTMICDSRIGYDLWVRLHHRHLGLHPRQFRDRFLSSTTLADQQRQSTKL